MKRVWPVANYSSGKKSRVVEIGDESGAIPLVLWNDDVTLADALRPRDEIEIKGAYERGGELHLGYNGRLNVINRAGFFEFSGSGSNISGSDSSVSTLPQLVHLRGFLVGLEGESQLLRNGVKMRVFVFLLRDGAGGTGRCIIYSNYARARQFEIGDEIIVEDAELADRTFWIGSGSRILSRRSKSMLIGEIGEILLQTQDGASGSNEFLRVVVGGREAILDRQNALRFLSLTIADDICLGTVVSLKKESLRNKKIALKIQEIDGKVTIVA